MYGQYSGYEVAALLQEILEKYVKAKCFGLIVFGDYIFMFIWNKKIGKFILSLTEFDILDLIVKKLKNYYLSFLFEFKAVK